MRKSLFLSLAALPGVALLIAGLAPQAESQIVSGPTGPCNSINRELVVNYDVTGGTLTGPINVNLQVYSNGEIKYSRTNSLTDDSSIQHVSIPRQQVGRLMKQLDKAGAYKLCDQNLFISDVPLNTLTVLSGGMDGRYHNFSYWVGFGKGYAEVGQALNDFISTNIPNP